MCGIFGMLYFDPQRPVDASTVRYATDTMIHRGPDDSGYFISGNVGLGHRRLSIIDLSSGHQPMMNEDGQIVTVYNGEIYNFQEIRQELISKGHIFKSKSDTEVIIHGYEEWGTDCVNRFNGMFAFILWDNRRKRLWVVRDRLGVKPLYYYIDDEVFVCSSEIKPILKSKVVKPLLNENVLDAYFSVGYVPGPETMFTGIKKMLPAHSLMIDGDMLSYHEYWDFSQTQCREISLNQAVEEISNLLLDSVRKRLMSDVSLGVFLSGGLDSSAVVGLMSKLVVDEPINTFTIGYREGFSEEKFAQAIADRFKTNHHVFYLDANNFFSSLKTLVDYAEEPIVEPAAIALYHVSKLAREKAIVLLSGEGSDEIFAGYYLYRFMEIINKLHQGFPAFLYPFARGLEGYMRKDKHRKYFDWIMMPLTKRYQGTSSYLTPSLKERYYHPDFYSNRSTYLDDKFAGYFNRVRHQEPLMQMLYVDTKTWLVDDLLIKADKMTMATSVELRVPFLDYRLVEAVASMPSIFKINNRKGKYLLKEVVSPFLPDEIIHREKKGFPVPTDNWFKGDLMPEIRGIIDEMKKTPWFDPAALDRIWLRHTAGMEDYSKFIMTLVVFAQWHHQYL